MPQLPRLHAVAPSSARVETIFVVLCRLRLCTRVWEMRQRAAEDFTLYTGALGTALLVFRAYSATGDRADLATCAEIVAACDAASAPAGQE